MIIIIIYTIFSFLIDAIMSNFVNTLMINPSYFRTIYSVISLVIIYNYFDNDNKYLKILVILGILFDIVYTNTFLLNVFIFLVIYFIIRGINNYIPNNLFTINIKSLLAIMTYHVLSFLILLLAHYESYTVNHLFLILTRSIIMTVIYTSASYLLIREIYYNKYHKKIK